MATNTYFDIGLVTDTTKWSLGHLPNATEDVVITGECGTNIDYTITCKSFTLSANGSIYTTENNHFSIVTGGSGRPELREGNL